MNAVKFADTQGHAHYLRAVNDGETYGPHNDRTHAGPEVLIEVISDIGDGPTYVGNYWLSTVLDNCDGATVGFPAPGPTMDVRVLLDLLTQVGVVGSWNVED